MDNLYELIRNGLHFNKFEVGELIFVEYTCPLEVDNTAIWSHSDFMVHVLSGKKTWRTPKNRWTVEAGETIYLKKGATIVNQFFDDDFCMLGFFISDDFIKSCLKDVSSSIKPLNNSVNQDPALKLNNNAILSGYFQSMLSYFSGREAPSDSILELKLKELVFNILTSSDNPKLSSYFQGMLGTEKPVLRQIMEDNFTFNLSLEEYAQMCHRSLSSFKRDFKKHFQVSPRKWLLNKRLDYAALLLRNSDHNITEIVYESGFEDSSHFSRVFKEKFNLSPSQYRKEIKEN